MDDAQDIYPVSPSLPQRRRWPRWLALPAALAALGWAAASWQAQAQSAPPASAASTAQPQAQGKAPSDGNWFTRLFKSPPAPRAVLPVPVRTALVQEKTVPVARNGIGSVLPVMSVTVKPRVDGQLDRVEFKEGQDVKAGQVLAHIDQRGYQAQLDQALAQKARDEATLANARADLARYEELMKEDATTRQTLDTQRAQVRQLQAAVQNDDAQIQLARVNLSYTTIAAPISGRVGARLVDPGNIVRAADPGGLLVINQIDPIAVQFTLPESAFQAVNAALHGSSDALAVQALDRNTREVLAEGRLALLNNQIDAATGTIAMKAHFPNPAHKLWPGQSVEARLILGQRQQALTVPEPAVQRGQNGLYAYVIDEDGKARIQPIQIDDGGAQGGIMVITRGLKAGERVVTDGHYKLTPGAHIAEMPAAGSSGPSGQPSAPAPVPQAGEGSKKAGDESKGGGKGAAS